MRQGGRWTLAASGHFPHSVHFPLYVCTATAEAYMISVLSNGVELTNFEDAELPPHTPRKPESTKKSLESSRTATLPHPMLPLPIDLGLLHWSKLSAVQRSSLFCSEVIEFLKRGCIVKNTLNSCSILLPYISYASEPASDTRFGQIPQLKANDNPHT